MLVLDSKDRQANLWLPLNVAKLAAFTIFVAKTDGITTLLQYIIKAEIHLKPV